MKVKKFDTKNESFEAARQLGNKKRFHTHDLISLSPKNRRQEMFFEEFHHGTQIISLLGYPGVGKTYLAMYAGLWDVFRDDTPTEKVVIIRSNVTSGYDVGFLPGPQPYSANVLTPTGWRRMGDLQVGDYVMAHDGSRVKILGVYEKGIKDIYEIETIQGNKTQACDDHLWLTKTQEEKKRNKPGKIRTTKEIRESLIGKRFRDGSVFEIPNHTLPKNSPMEFVNDSDFKFSPYLLGYLLGDGNFQGTPGLVVHERDFEELSAKIRQEIKKYPTENLTYSVQKYCDNMYLINFIKTEGLSNKRGKGVRVKSPSGDVEIFRTTKAASRALKIDPVTIVNRCKNGGSTRGYSFEYDDIEIGDKYNNPLRNILDELGLLNKTYGEKFLPEFCIYNFTVEQRLELLRGLMDSDGSCSKSGEAKFYNSSLNLINGVVQLVNSLGGYARITNRGVRESGDRLIKGRKIIHKSNSYEISMALPEEMNPFNFTRKKSRFSQKMYHVDRIKDIKYVGRENARCILIDHPDHLYITDDYIVTHNTLDEKQQPYEAPYQAITKEIIKYNDPYPNLKSLGYVEFVMCTHLRGITFDNAIIIIEECQNYDYEMLYTCISRAGTNSRIILTGDVRQDDLISKRKKSGLPHLLNVFRNMPYRSTVEIEFKAEDVVRSGIVRDFVIADFETPRVGM